MATQEDAKRAQEEKEEAERKNPLLKLGLGDLVGKAVEIISKDHELDSNNAYHQYHQIIREINRREEEYKRWKPEPRF